MIWQTIQDGKTQEAIFVRIPIKIVEPNQDELIITSEPRMPSFIARVESEDPTLLKTKRGDISAYTWGIRIKHDIGSDLHIDARIEDFKSDSEIYRPNFDNLKDIKEDGSILNLEGGVVGGELTLSIDYYENLHIEKKYTLLKGTNPGQAAIEQVLTDKTLRQIACQESRYKQFKAPREGGIGPLNTQFGKIRGGVGIMQLFKDKPTSAQAWNWRENLKAGILLYNTKHDKALKLPITELGRLNEKRKELELPACTKTLPMLNAEQLARETLRRYNCGREYRWEPIDAPNCEGQWVISPSCAITNPTAYNKEYVNNVLKCDINH